MRASNELGIMFSVVGSLCGFFLFVGCKIGESIGEETAQKAAIKAGVGHWKIVSPASSEVKFVYGKEE